MANELLALLLVPPRSTLSPLLFLILPQWHQLLAKSVNKIVVRWQCLHRESQPIPTQGRKHKLIGDVVHETQGLRQEAQ